MLHTASIGKMLRLGLAAAGLAAIVGCASSNQAWFASAYPLDRARAAVRAADAGDADAVDFLVGMLDDDDAGVRMYAIMALKRLCGETYGYCYYAPEAERAEAVTRWRDARQCGEVTLLARSGKPAREDKLPASTTERDEQVP